MSTSESIAQLASAPTSCVTTSQHNPISGKNMLQDMRGEDLSLLRKVHLRKDPCFS